MEIYLNVAEWGPNGEFGVEAGSRRAFNKSAQRARVRRGGPAGRHPAEPDTRNARQPGPGVRRLACRIYERRAMGAGALIGCIRRGKSRPAPSA